LTNFNGRACPSVEFSILNTTPIERPKHSDLRSGDLVMVESRTLTTVVKRSVPGDLNSFKRIISLGNLRLPVLVLYVMTFTEQRHGQTWHMLIVDNQIFWIIGDQRIVDLTPVNR